MLISIHSQVQLYAMRGLCGKRDSAVNQLSDGFLKRVDASTYGTKMPRASWDYIKNLPILLLDYYEQQTIADYLDKRCGEIDSIIADIEKQIELLKQYKKSLITETVTKGLDKSVPMKDSGVSCTQTSEKP